MRLGSKTILLSLVIAVGVYPQGLPRTTSTAERQGSIRGNVVMPDGSPVSGAVRVTLKVMRGDVTTAYTDEQGRFELNNLASGLYTLEVESDRDRRFEISTERVQIARGGGPSLVTVFLKFKRDETTVTRDKTVSVVLLDQKVPSAAKREFDKATQLARKGRSDEAIDALKRAVTIYPDYLMALNDLGAQLLERQRFDEAEIELRKAVNIDPDAFNPALNLGIVLLSQNKATEATVLLEKALSIEPSSPAGHMFLGVALAKLSDSDRGEKELKTAHELGGTSYAVALFHLGQLYMKKGKRELALNSFQAYLRESPKAANAAQVEELIASLR
jgi:Flp pilus assembly protein TadD